MSDTVVNEPFIRIKLHKTDLPILYYEYYIANHMENILFMREFLWNKSNSLMCSDGSV